MCKELSIAPSTYYRHVQLQCHPERRGAQVCQREARLVEIKRVYDESNGIYGARKVWRQLLREGITMAHGTVERLMRRAGLQGVWRGKGKHTTVSEGRTCRIWSNATSARAVQTSCGWRTSPTCRRAAATFTPPSSLTCTAVISSAGVAQATLNFRRWNGWTGSTSASC